jgi:hypothetical protein
MRELTRLQRRDAVAPPVARITHHTPHITQAASKGPACGFSVATLGLDVGEQGRKAVLAAFVDVRLLLGSFLAANFSSLNHNE